MDSQIQDSPSSGRKQLPSIPSDPRMNHSQLKSPANLGANGYGTYFQEYSLMAEYNQLHRQKMPGVYVIPSAHCSHIWNGVLFIRQGLYQEGVFRFTLTIPDNYPDSECPSLVFEYPIFHPVVHPKTGEVDVKRAFPRWRRNNNHLWQVLLYARRIFYKIEIKDPLNEEAADLYLQDLEKFKKKVSESVKSAKTQALEPPKSDDPFAIRFNEMDPALFEQAKQDMLNSKVGLRACAWKIKVFRRKKYLRKLQLKTSARIRHLSVCHGCCQDQQRYFQQKTLACHSIQLL